MIGGFMMDFKIELKSRTEEKLQTALDAAIRRFAGFNDCTIISRSEGDGE